MFTAPLLIAAVLVAGFLVARRLSTVGRRAPLGVDDVLDLHWLAVAGAVVLMAWTAVIDAVTFGQIALVAVFVVALGMLVREARDRGQRCDVLGHGLLSLATIWMLVAMPFLMTGDVAHTDPHAGHAGHEGHDHGAAVAAAPAWAAIGNAVAIGLCGVVAVWFLVRAFTASGRRLRSVADAVLAACLGRTLAALAA